MPIVVDRRGFLKHTAAAAAGLALARKGWGADAALARVALFSDTHIAADPADTFRGFNPSKNLQQAVRQASKGNFSLLVVNGDLARMRGLPEDYAQFNSLINPLLEKAPMVASLGNHDERKNALTALTKRTGKTEPVEAKFVTTVDAGPFNFVLLDSLLATALTPGQLGKAQRDWLSGYLDGLGDKPSLLFVHHNPDAEHDVGLVDADRLLAILKPRRSVKALIFGHLHVYSFQTQDGLHLINLPAVGYNFADGNPVGWIEASIAPDGADLKLHALAGETKDDGKITTLSWR